MSDFIRVSPGEPCPVCGKDHGCDRLPNGLYFCFRSHGEHISGFRYLGERGPSGMYARSDDTPWQPNDSGRFSTADRTEARRKRRRDFTEHHAKNVVPRLNTMTQAQRKQLASQTGLPPHLFASDRLLFTQWLPDDNGRPEWWFPERNAAGEVIGWVYRDSSGKKLMVKDSSRGLYLLPEVFTAQNLAGKPVLIVEGATDTLACHALGIPAIGRPSVTGGLDHLVELIKSRFKDRRIIVIGENDAKPDGRWPGRDDSRRFATDLAERLDKVACVSFAMTPDGAKDVRDWLTGKEPKLYKGDRNWKLASRGEEFLTKLLAAAAEIDPASIYLQTPEQKAAFEEYLEQRRRNREAEEAQERQRPRCEHTYKVFLVHRTENRGRIGDVACKKWHCPACAAKLKAKWVSSACTHFMESPWPISVLRIDEGCWPALHKRIQRVKRQYLCVRHPSGGITVFTNMAIDDAGILPPLEAAQRFERVLHDLPLCSKPISSSRAWKLLQDDEKTGEWMRLKKHLSQVAKHLTLEEAVQIVKQNGLHVKVKRSRSGGWMQRVADFQFPQDWLWKRVVDLAFQLHEGTYIPRSRHEEDEEAMAQLTGESRFDPSD
jgi:hypothetical protein